MSTIDAGIQLSFWSCEIMAQSLMKTSRAGHEGQSSSVRLQDIPTTVIAVLAAGQLHL
jgi:hypothetical protein